MFTGIIEAVGEIKKIIPLENGVRIEITSGGLDLSDLRIGDSIATNGVCLTITTLMGNTISMEVSRETLSCTQSLDTRGGRVNLEKAMQLSDRINGHLVSGHVDGVGKIIKLEPAGESYILAIRPPIALMKYIAKKGSITVNGVSLTVVQSENNLFSVHIIPYTIEHTNFKALKVGTRVNLEFDIIGKYVKRLMENK